MGRGLRGEYTTLSLGFLLFANLSMVVNSTNIASSYLGISSDFRQGVFGLGLLTTSFFLSYGIFEVPGGIFAVKTGPRKIMIGGTILAGTAVILTGLSPFFDLVVVLRFLAGIGAAFAFPATLVLILRHVKRHSQGFGTGLMVLSGNAGSMIGLSVWSVLSADIGWRPSIVLSGLMALVPAIALIFLLPHDQTSATPAFKFSQLKKVILNKPIAIISIALFGIGAGFVLITGFIVYYLELDLKTSPLVAGLVGGLGAISATAVAPFVGRVYDRTKKVKLMFMASLVVVSLATALVSLGSLTAALFGAILAGAGSGSAFTIGITAAREATSTSSEYETLTIGWVDSFSLYGNMISPLYFSALVLTDGYHYAWLVGGLVTLIFALPIVALKVQSRPVHLTAA